MKSLNLTAEERGQYLEVEDKLQDGLLLQMSQGNVSTSSAILRQVLSLFRFVFLESCIIGRHIHQSPSKFSCLPGIPLSGNIAILSTPDWISLGS